MKAIVYVVNGLVRVSKAGRAVSEVTARGALRKAFPSHDPAGWRITVQTHAHCTGVEWIGGPPEPDLRGLERGPEDATLRP